MSEKWTFEDFVKEANSCEIQTIKCSKCGKIWHHGEVSPWDDYCHDGIAHTALRHEISQGKNEMFIHATMNICDCGNPLTLNVNNETDYRNFEIINRNE